MGRANGKPSCAQHALAKRTHGRGGQDQIWGGKLYHTVGRLAGRESGGGEHDVWERSSGAWKLSCKSLFPQKLSQKFSVFIRERTDTKSRAVFALPRIAAYRSCCLSPAAKFVIRAGYYNTENNLTNIIINIKVIYQCTKLRITRKPLRLWVCESRIC